jgi:hypothetical protein
VTDSETRIPAESLITFARTALERLGLGDAEAGIETMGGTLAFVNALHKGSKSDELTELKEGLELGQFAEICNRTNIPRLVYAARNAPRSGRADFTVWDETLTWSRDIELTSIWDNDDDFPRVTDKEDPSITHVWLSAPRLPITELQVQITREIKRVLRHHARRSKYPPYWLSIYPGFPFPTGLPI